MVVGPVAASRFASFGSYVAYRTEEVATFAGIKSRQHIVASLARFERRASKVAPRASQGATGNERLGLEIDQRELLLTIIQPSDPGNPFKPKLRIRNHAMILLAYVFAWRAGEELGLKGKDYDTRSTPATLTVHRRPGDPEETRNEPPLAKTLSRTLYVDGDTRPAMDAWIKDRQDRSKYPKARKHPYIFVATDGSPLTLRGARAVYERLGSAYPELAGITQHILRHDANDRWIEYNEAQGLDPTSSRQDQCYAMGWSSMSKMPDKYAKAAISRRSNKRMRPPEAALSYLGLASVLGRWIILSTMARLPVWQPLWLPQMLLRCLASRLSRSAGDRTMLLSVRGSWQPRQHPAYAWRRSRSGMGSARA